METRLFDPIAPPVHTTREWYATRERARHLEEDWHRGRMLLAAAMVKDAIARHGIQSVSDMGCGDGGMLTLIAGEIPVWGYDLQPTNVAGGRERGVHVRLGDAVHDAVEWGELAICTEVLEHLVNPHDFLRAAPARVIVASSPANESAESHYGFHTWVWDMDGYAAMFTSAGYTVERHEREGLFQVLQSVRSE